MKNAGYKRQYVAYTCLYLLGFVDIIKILKLNYFGITAYKRRSLLTIDSNIAYVRMDVAGVPLNF